ncbi:glycosyltransferase [Lentzea sp. NPDC055074]
MGSSPERSTSTRMRIAIVSEHASPLAAPGAFDTGSRNVHVAGLATALAALGHQVVVYTRRDHPHVPQRVHTTDGYDVVHVQAGPAMKMSTDDVLFHTGDFVQFLELAWEARRPDVVHAHGWLSGVVAVLGARKHKVPVVQTYYATRSTSAGYQRANDSASAKRFVLERIVGHEVARVVAVCTSEAHVVLGMGVDRSKLAVVPRGVDLDLFTPGRASSGQNRARRIVSVGRLLPRKGFEDTIRALSQLNGVELVVAGTGAPGGQELKRLRGLADARGVGDRVVFAGHVPQDELPALLRSADVLVCTPRHESSGGAVLEAMACGVPVVATSVGGLVDPVMEGHTGVLVAPGKPEWIAKALKALLDDETRREMLGLAARDRVHARYSWSRVAADLVRTYDSAIKPQQAPLRSPTPSMSARASTSAASS